MKLSNAAAIRIRIRFETLMYRFENRRVYQPAARAMQVFTARPPSKIRSAMRIWPSVVTMATKAITAYADIANPKVGFIRFHYPVRNFGTLFA